MESVQKFVLEALPNLECNKCDKLLKKLNNIGVKSLCDLSLVEQADIADILLPIQTRKFIRNCYKCKYYLFTRLFLVTNVNCGRFFKLMI